MRVDQCRRDAFAPKHGGSDGTGKQIFVVKTCLGMLMQKPVVL